MLAKCKRCERLIWAGRIIGGVCESCISELRPVGSEVGPDRFWIPMTLVPLGMMAGLALLAVYMVVIWR